MSVKVYRNGAWQEASVVRHYYDGAWTLTTISAYKNGAWEDMNDANGKIIYYGTNFYGYTAYIKSLWYPYTTYTESTERYVKLPTSSTSRIQMRSKNWSRNPVIFIGPIDTTGYITLEVTYYIKIYQSSEYNNGLNIGLTKQLPSTYLYQNNPITVVCDGYNITEQEAIRLDKTQNNKKEKFTANLNFSYNGLAYVWIAPISWSAGEDWTEIEIISISLK